MATLKTLLKKLVDEFFPAPPPRPMHTRKTVAKLVSEGYTEFLCSPETYTAMVNLAVPEGATGSQIKGLFGATVSFTFYRYAPVGCIIPMKAGCPIREEAIDV